MKIIKCLSEYIEEELHDAEKYIVHAMKVKAEYPELAELFYQLSVEEMSHMNRLHGEVEKLIAAKKRSGVEIPAGMQAVYDYLHERMIEKAKAVKIEQGMFRE